MYHPPFTFDIIYTTHQHSEAGYLCTLHLLWTYNCHLKPLLASVMPLLVLVMEVVSSSGGLPTFPRVPNPQSC